MSDKMERKSQSFSFQNLQPINYLKTFNKMLQSMGKPLPFQTAQTSRQLKLVKFSKFPIYSYYGQMQGILEGHQKKHKQNQRLCKKDLQQQENEQRFVKRHHQFVKSAINKILEDNQIQQKLLLKSKKFHLSGHFAQKSDLNRQQIIKLVKHRSEPKLRKPLNIKLGSAKSKNAQKEIDNKIGFRSLQKINSMRSKDKIKMGSKTQKLIHQKVTNNKSFKRINQNPLSHQTQTNLKTLHSQADSKNKDLQKPNPKLNSLNQSKSITQKINQSKNTMQSEFDNPIFKKLQLPGETSKFRTRNKAQIRQIFESNQNEKKHQKKHYYALTERDIYQVSQNKNLQNQSYKNLRQQELNQFIHPNIPFKTEKDKFQLSKINQKIQPIFNEIMELKQDKIQNSQQISIRNLPQFSKRLKNQDEQSTNSNPNKNQLSEFQRLVESLHQEKTKTQVLFSANIESNIKSVNRQIEQRIQKVKKFDISNN